MALFASGAATAVPPAQSGRKIAVQWLTTLVAPLHAALHGAARRVPPCRASWETQITATYLPGTTSRQYRLAPAGALLWLPGSTTRQAFAKIDRQQDLLTVQ